MEKNKKAEISVLAIISIFLVVMILVLVFIPTYTASVDSGVTLECNDAVLDTLNTTTETCFNGTHMSVTAQATQTGITRRQEAMLLIVPTFMVLGALFLIGRKVGIIGKN